MKWINWIYSRNLYKGNNKTGLKKKISFTQKMALENNAFTLNFSCLCLAKSGAIL